MTERRNREFRGSILALGSALLLAAAPAAAIDDHLLLCEAVVTPTSNEFIEVVNPTAAPMDLTNYYLSDDEDYALLPGASGAGPAPSIGSSDFIVQFPVGASIPPGGVVVVAFDGAGFLAAFGSAADYEIHGTDPGTPDMIPTDVGSATAGLTNSGENAVLFFWDGASDLVIDVDMLNIGTPSSTNDIGDKTGVTVDGPDAGTTTSTYALDLFTMPQQAGDPGFGTSTKRMFLETGNETTGGGNGITGDDETTEQITSTWDSPPFSAPNPGTCDGVTPPLPVVVINEIMQNPSAVFDSNGEWFEVFNPTASAIDIEGWTIEDDGTNSHTISNGGPLLVPAGGYLVLGNNADSGTNGGVTVDYQYSSFTLGNSDDEVVLLDTSATEIDRVDYDGGPAFPDPTGASMALIDPALDNNVGANWCTSSTAFGDGDLGTPGTANDCVVEVPEIVINEIMQNPSAVSDNNGEWFEVFNSGASAIDIDGWTIKDDGSNSHTISNGGPLLVPAGGYLVLGRDANPVTNGGVTVDYQYSDFFLGNSDDEVVLLDASAAEIDRVNYDGGPAFPDPNGAAMALASPLFDNNVGANWCTSSTPFGSGDSGTPGAINDCPPPEIVINEIMQNPSAVSDGSGEWFEIFNATDAPVDIDGWTIKDDGSNTHTISNGGPLLVPAGGYLVLGNNANSGTNGGVTVDYQYSSFFLANGDDEVVLLDTLAQEIDRVNYDGGPAFPDPTGASMALTIPGLDNNVGANWCTSSTPFGAGDSGTPGAMNDCPGPEIYEIQSSDLFSPFAGFAVTTEDNVVTCLGTDGFFIQTPTSRSDGDVATSDGIFVLTGGAPGVAVGDIVDVTGTVEEFFGFTRLAGGPAVTVTGNDPSQVPAAVLFNSAVPSPDPLTPSCGGFEFECYEGMLVSIADGTVTGPNQRFGSDPIAEVHVTAAPARTFREPGIEFPGLGGLTWDGNPEVFELDPDKLGLANQIIPAGSSFSANGVLGFEFGGYELWPNELDVAPAPLPVAVRSRELGESTVGSLNLFRLFDDFNDPPSVNSVGQNRDDFVVSTAEYVRRLVKFATYIVDVMDSPGILAVQEAEKLGVLQDLATAVNVIDPSVNYTASLIEGNDVGTIDVGFLVRDNVQIDNVTQLGYNELFTFDDPPSPLHDRPPLLLEATCDGTFPVAVMVLHMRSLNNIETTRTQQKRFEQAESVAQKVQDIQTANPDVHLVVLGDFNAFEFSDGYVDLTGIIKGDFDPGDSLVCGFNSCVDLVEPDLTDEVVDIDAEERYSFIFRGNSQVLDHAMTSDSLAELVTGFEYGRGNADAAVDLINDDSTELRSSDHDGLVLYVLKDEDHDGVPDFEDVCLGTSIPEDVPTQSLGVNRWALDDGDTIFDTTPPPGGGGGPGLGFTVEDTAGCSCEQIIDALHLGNGHRKFGCSNGAMLNWVDLVNP